MSKPSVSYGGLFYLRVPGKASDLGLYRGEASPSLTDVFQNLKSLLRLAEDEPTRIPASARLASSIIIILTSSVWRRFIFRSDLPN